MNLADLLLNLVPALLMAVITLIMVKFPPKAPNALYGYRTIRSMKSQEAWDFANRRSIYYFTLVTVILIIAGVAMTFLAPFEKAQMILYVGWPVLLVALIPLIEKELKKNFTEDGKRRE